MALNGINLPLAFTGQEALWQEVRKSESSAMFFFCRLDQLLYFSSVVCLAAGWHDSLSSTGKKLKLEENRLSQKPVHKTSRKLCLTLK